MAPTARAAFGLPALAATALYVRVFPFGILRTMSRTLSENVFAFFTFDWNERVALARKIRPDVPVLVFEVRAAVLTLWAAIGTKRTCKPRRNVRFQGNSGH